MPRFLFQPDPIDEYEFNPIPIDIHLGVIKIPTEAIMEDGAINNTEAVLIGTDRMEVINRLQTVFARVSKVWETQRVRYSIDGL